MVIVKQPVNSQLFSQDNFNRSNIQQQNYNNRRTSNFFQQPPPQLQVQAPAQQRRYVSWNNRIDERIIDKRQGNYQDRNVRSGYFDGIQRSKAKADPITIKIKAIGTNRPVTIVARNITTSRN
jgi:hypothetical protein